MTSHAGLRQSLDQTLTRLRSRKRTRDALALAGRGAFYGCIAGALGALTAALLAADWSQSGVWWSAAFLPLGAVLGVLIALLRPLNDLALARALDRAAVGEDRFASALQLSGHHRVERVELVLADALAHVGPTGASAALPLRAPRELRWLPVPAAVLALVLWLVPGPQPAPAAPPPDVSADEWKSLHEQLAKDLQELPEPQTPEERELAEQLQKLAEMLKENPEKKDALAEIAKLRAELDKKAEALGNQDVSLRQAAQSMRSSAALSRFAALLQAGDYQAAASELAALADQLQQDQLALSAEDYEAAASDLEELAKELASQDELSQECRNAATAASRMNRDQLADALKKLSKNLNKNARKLKQCDGLCRSRSMLDELARRLSKCKGGKCGKCSGCGEGDCEGDCAAFVKKNDKKGGLKPGWGTASKWDGGKVSDNAEERLATLEETEETDGEVSVTPTVSPDERARSGQEFRDTYANMVRKAEADLALETVPPSLRDFLRRYFVAIRPAEEPAAEE